MDRLIGRRQRQAGRLVLVVCAGLVAGAAAGWGATAANPPFFEDSQTAPQTFGIAQPQNAAKALKPAPATPSEKAGIDLATVTVPEVRLAAVDRDALLKEDALNERTGQTKILRFGIARPLRVAAANGAWYDAGEGARLWVSDVVSTGALGLRVHFDAVHLPPGAELAVYGANDKSGAAGTLANGFAGFDRRLERFQGSEAQAERTDFWTGTLPGERVRIEYLAPADAAGSNALPFAVDNLQHVYFDPVAKLAESLIRNKDAAGPCHNDVTCFPEWADVAKAVSGLGIIFAGGSGFCTGQLINDQAADFTPYFLTAHHCLNTQKEATTSEYFWLYQTPTCNGTPPDINSVPRSTGATLVSTSANSDYTLLMVEGALPDGLFWAGWTAARIADGTTAACIHHPSGDFKRISFGFKDESSACPDVNNFVRISWTDGPTEPGSSGSGVFRLDTHQLFGQLLGGPSACGSETFDCYGAFAATYPKVKNPLRKGWDDAYEPNNTCAQAHQIFTGSVKNRVVKLLDPDWYKIKVPAGKTLTARVNFINANGDVDLDLQGPSCDGDPATTSRTTNDQEIVQLTNRTGTATFFYLKVYLASDTRNTYKLTTSIR
ncbi:MAG TPA: serine protease [Thermoanaerobaculia bacterium]|nr:serine protease [Thermoanaerobaculia bacterium]